MKKIYFFILFLLISSLAYSTEIETRGNRFWAKEIVKGGYILHFRHGNRHRYIQTTRTPETDVTSFDAVSLRLGLKGEDEDFGKVTCLTEEGKIEATLVGRAFKILKIKVGEVLSSPSCRARQTAFIAFGTEGKIVNSILHRTAVMKEQHKDFAKNLRKHIMEIKMIPGSNAILSGHVGTLDFNSDILFDKVEIKDPMYDRDDIGFVIIERTKNDKLIARYMFKNFAEFSREVIKLPLN